jgi:orotate phosphoribosyltransferase
VDLLEELDRAGAVLRKRHFIYSSGRHGEGYINPDAIFPDVDLLSKICDKLVEPFDDGIDTVAGPATGGIILAVLAALALRKRNRGAAAVWADKDEGDFVFQRRGFTDHLRGKRVLVVEDLLTTGSSVERVCRAGERHGAHIVGVSAICNRGGITADRIGVRRLETLVNVDLQSFDSDQCPLCANGVPIVENIGYGDRYKAAHSEYPGGYIRVAD